METTIELFRVICGLWKRKMETVLMQSRVYLRLRKVQRSGLVISFRETSLVQILL